jgi:hypothetical protein
MPVRVVWGGLSWVVIAIYCGSWTCRDIEQFLVSLGQYGTNSVIMGITGNLDKERNVFCSSDMCSAGEAKQHIS